MVGEREGGRVTQGQSICWFGKLCPGPDVVNADRVPLFSMAVMGAQIPGEDVLRLWPLGL